MREQSHLLSPLVIGPKMRISPNQLTTTQALKQITTAIRQDADADY
jgi:hypothetical protein